MKVFLGGTMESEWRDELIPTMSVDCIPPLRYSSNNNQLKEICDIILYVITPLDNIYGRHMIDIVTDCKLYPGKVYFSIKTKDKDETFTDKELRYLDKVIEKIKNNNGIYIEHFYDIPEVIEKCSMNDSIKQPSPKMIKFIQILQQAAKNYVQSMDKHQESLAEKQQKQPVVIQESTIKITNTEDKPKEKPVKVIQKSSIKINKNIKKPKENPVKVIQKSSIKINKNIKKPKENPVKVIQESSIKINKPKINKITENIQNNIPSIDVSNIKPKTLKNKIQKIKSDNYNDIIDVYKPKIDKPKEININQEITIAIKDTSNIVKPKINKIEGDEFNNPLQYKGDLFTKSNSYINTDNIVEFNKPLQYKGDLFTKSKKDFNISDEMLNSIEKELNNFVDGIQFNTPLNQWNTQTKSSKGKKLTPEQIQRKDKMISMVSTSAIIVFYIIIMSVCMYVGIECV